MRKKPKKPAIQKGVSLILYKITVNSITGIERQNKREEVLLCDYIYLFIYYYLFITFIQYALQQDNNDRFQKTLPTLEICLKDSHGNFSEGQEGETKSPGPGKK